MRQYNYILNRHNKLLDLVINNMDCAVSRNYIPSLNEDQYHPALLLMFLSVNINKRTFNFKKANYHNLYN